MEHFKSKCENVCYDPKTDRLIHPPSQPQQLNSACLFLIRAVGEFSAQNENSRENPHHHRTAKFSISRNYAWPDVSSTAFMGFFNSFFFFFFFWRIVFFHFWLNKEKSPLLWPPLFLLSTENKLKGKKKCKVSSYPKGLYGITQMVYLNSFSSCSWWMYHLVISSDAVIWRHQMI